ncbi:MAG TPA: cupredoxin domain-containing protein [Acidimicrobiales bacterium]|nr:cupredoxin domain-containing protein [Acidimicrobiales bacterium]
MLTQSAKVFLPISVVGLVFGVGYMVLTGNRDGFLLLLFLSVVAACAGIAVARVRENEFAPTVPADAPAPEYHDVVPGRPLAGGLWAATGALAFTLLLVGFVLGPLATAGGLVVAAATVVGWMTTVSSEHTGRRIDLAPLGLPVLGLCTIFALMFCISRVLLAVPEQASTAIALAVAVVILGGASVVAMRPRVSSRALAGVLALSAVLLTAGGIIAAAVGQREVHKPAGVSAGPVSIEAVNSQFDLTEFELQADIPAQIRFHNKDENVPHNVAIYGDDKYTQEIFVGDILPGPITIEYRLEAPHPGEYFFRCDVHPNMAGKVKVVAAEGEEH